MNLSPEERMNFVKYLNQVSTDDDKLAEECEKIEQAGLAARLRNEAKAARIVAGRLLSIHEEEQR
jgi:hypothetical protein